MGLRLDGYVRVSQVRGREGDSFISPQQQRDRITQYVQAYGHELLVVHEELDESGARADRPQLLAAIERVERGEIDGIVVAKLDRFARSLVDGLRMIERIQDAGGTFVSVADGLDLSTDTGRLVLRIMLSLAEFELDRVRGNWADAKARAVMRGIHPSARAPFGYRREGAPRRAGGGGTGPLVVDPVTGPIVTELFARRDRGAGVAELCDWLQSIGARTIAGNGVWSQRAIKDILRNPVYVGEAYAGDVRNPDAHQALVDHETFARVSWRGVQFRPKSAHVSPIRPLLRCAGCRYSARAERRTLKGGDVWYFSCKTHTGPRQSWECHAPFAIKDDGTLEQTIVDTFLNALPDIEARGRQESPRLGELERQVADARHAFEEWRDDVRIQQQLGMDAYLAGLQSRQDALNDAIAELARERARLGAVVLPASAAEIRERWPLLSSEDQRDLLRAAIRCVFVRGSSRTAPLDGRLLFVWQGEDVDLPSRGRSWTSVPIDY